MDQMDHGRGFVLRFSGASFFLLPAWLNHLAEQESLEGVA